MHILVMTFEVRQNGLSHHQAMSLVQKSINKFDPKEQEEYIPSHVIHVNAVGK